MAVQFSGAGAGTAPLTWGQKAILADMRASADQFTMFGTILAAPGLTAQDAASSVRSAVSRHAALRMRLAAGPDGRPGQEVAAEGELTIDVRRLPDTADLVDLARYAEHLLAVWPEVPFDFEQDWPLRVAVLMVRGSCRGLIFTLSHLAADGMANMTLLGDLSDVATGVSTAGDPPAHQILEVARSEAEPQLRHLSSRTMRYWEAQLRSIPALTFGEPVLASEREGSRYWQLRFSSPAADLAIRAIARRTGTDLSRTTLAVIATAIGRTTGVSPLPVNVMMSNRFRPGLAEVFAPIAQNAVVTIDAAGTCVDEVVRRARAATLTAGMRAYYDPDDLADLVARLDAERGYQGRVTCRFNDQRTVARRPPDDASLDDLSPQQLRAMLTQTALTWYRALDQLQDQLSIVILTRTKVLTIDLKCDLWCLPPARAELLLRCIEEVAIEAAFDPAAPTRIGSGGAGAEGEVGVESGEAEIFQG